MIEKINCPECHFSPCQCFQLRQDARIITADKKVEGEDLRRLEKLARDSNKVGKFYLRGQERENIMPMGRAKNMGLNLLNMSMGGEYPFCKDGLKNYKLSVFPDGSIYTCCFLKNNLIIYLPNCISGGWILIGYIN